MSGGDCTQTQIDRIETVLRETFAAAEPLVPAWIDLRHAVINGSLTINTCPPNWSETGGTARRRGR